MYFPSIRMMAYVFPIHHMNTNTTFNQNTVHLISQCDVSMVTDSNFEYAKYVVTFLVILFKMVFLRSIDIQEYNIISIHIKYIKIHHRRFEEASNRSMYTN